MADADGGGGAAGARRRALVLGLGRFGGGREAARFLLRRGWRLRISDAAPPETLAESMAAVTEAAAACGEDAIQWRLGPPEPELLDGVELLVVNPAVGDAHPLLARARERGVACTQEVSLFLDHYFGRVVLVTGTNGKSSTTTLLAAALQAAGHDVLAGGNLGRSLLACEAEWRTGQVAVVEISSFQLERLDPRRQRVAGSVITRVTVDHLDRHGTLAAYQRAKAVAAAAADDFLVHGAEDPVACAFATRARRRVTFTRGRPGPGQVGCDDGWITTRLLADGERVLHVDALHVLGAFQHENVQAAFAAARLLGADAGRAAVGLVQQRPLPHRLQLLFRQDGIALYDNGVSTEALSTLSALETLAMPVRWVGGGKSKDGDYRRVAALLGPRLASAHLFGSAATPLAAELQGRVPVTTGVTVEEALAAAWRHARPGDGVLFSPAFASFDQFPNFRARAQRFLRWADQLRSHGAPASGGGGAGRLGSASVVS
jgi:UDP-N-acetylmuramoylalanine--D-glutamate ligase